MSQPQTELARHFVFLKAIRDFVKTASLDGVKTAECKILKFPFNRKLTFAPGLFVSPYPEEVEARGSAGDVFTYKAAVTVVSDPSNGVIDDESEINRALLWRQNLYALLLPLTDVALPGCSWIRDLMITPGPLFDLNGFQAMFDVTQILVLGSTVQMRGTQNVT